MFVRRKTVFYLHPGGDEEEGQSSSFTIGNFFHL